MVIPVHKHQWKHLTVSLVGLIILFSQTVLAQDGGSSGALADVIIDALEGFLQTIFRPISDTLSKFGSELVRTIVSTPHPNAVFDRPTNAAWPRIYDYYWGTIVPLALSLWGLAIGVVIFLETTSHLFSGYHRSKLKKRAFSGLVGILSWWWLAALSLRFVDALTGVLVPSLSEVTLFETASFGSMGVLGLVLALGTDLALFVLLALIYTIRHLVLYLFVLLMPVLLVLWIPGVGPFALVARFVRKLAGFYVPFLFMTVPVAVLFRLGELLGGAFGPSMGSLGAWLTAIVIPFIALLVPLVMFWQAGGIFFLGDRMARRVSTRTAQARIADARTAGRETAHGGRNFLRGARGQPAVKQGGQYVLGSGDSRAHAAGGRVTAASTHLRSAFRRNSGRREQSGATEPAPTTEKTTDAVDPDASDASDRSTDFSHMRDRPAGDAPADADADDEESNQLDPGDPTHRYLD